MKISLQLKLGITVVLLFAVLIAGMFLYRPLRYAWLKSKLLSDDPKVRAAAVETLASDGARAIPHLRRWLEFGNDQLILNVCEILTKTDRSTRELARPELETLIDGPPSAITDAAFKALLHETEYSERFRICRKPEHLRNLYCYMLKIPPDELPDADEVNAAAHNLATLGDPLASDSLMTCLAHDYGRLGNKMNVEIRTGVIKALGEIGEKRALPEIIEILKSDEDESLRQWAAWALGRIGGEEAVEALIIALKNDQSDGCRAEAAVALGVIGDAKAIEPLMNLIESEEEECDELEYYPAWALAEIGGERIFQRLISKINKDAERHVVERAAYALGRMGDARAADVLYDFLKNHDRFYEYSRAAGALAKLGDERVYDLLVRGFKGEIKDKDDIRWAVLSTPIPLGILGDRRATPLLMEMLHSALADKLSSDYEDNRDIAFKCAMALEKMADPQSFDGLLKVFDYKDFGYGTPSYYSAAALTRISGSETVEKLLDAYRKAVRSVTPGGLLGTDTSERVPGMVLAALSASGNEAAIKPLIEEVRKGDEERSATFALMNFDRLEVGQLCREMDNDEEVYLDGEISYFPLVWCGEKLQSEDYDDFLYKGWRWTPDTLAGRERKWEEPAYFYFDENYDRTYELFHACRARWGNKRSLERILSGLLTTPAELVSLCKKIFLRMPEGFPEYDFRKRYCERAMQAKAIKTWFRENKHRLAWDAEERRYYLKK